MQYNGIQTPPSIIEIYAHRGGRGLRPENTLKAFESAINLGVDYIEFDVVMTKDRVLVITHDLSLNRDITRDGRGNFISKSIPIWELKYQQLKHYNVGKINPESKYAAFFPMQIPFEEAKIPTLKEGIDFINLHSDRKVGFQIEIKLDAEHPELSDSPESVAKGLYKILTEEKIIDRTEVLSFNHEFLQELQKLDASIKTIYLTPSRTPLNYTTLTKLKAAGGSGLGAHELDLAKCTIDQAHHLGLKVVAWGEVETEGTEFNYPQVEKLIDWGVDGITTDRPDLLRALLEKRGYSLPHKPKRETCIHEKVR